MGDAEGLVLKGRKSRPKMEKLVWSFFLKIGSQDSIRGVKVCVCFFPGAEKGIFRHKRFHLSTFQVMMLVVTIEGGRAPK